MVYKLINIDDSFEYFKKLFTNNKAEFYKTMLDEENNKIILRKTITSLEKEMLHNDFSDVEEHFGEITAVQYYLCYIEKQLNLKSGILFSLYGKYRSKKNNAKNKKINIKTKISREKTTTTSPISTILQVSDTTDIPNSISIIENKSQLSLSKNKENNITPSITDISILDNNNNKSDNSDEYNSIVFFQDIEKEMEDSSFSIKNCLAWKIDKIFENNSQFDSAQKALVLKANFEDTCKAYMSFLNSFDASFSSKIVLPSIGEMTKNEFPMYFYAWVKTNEENIRKNLSQSLSLLFNQIDKKIIFINKYNLSLDDFFG